MQRKMEVGFRNEIWKLGMKKFPVPKHVRRIFISMLLRSATGAGNDDSRDQTQSHLEQHCMMFICFIGPEPD